MKLEPDGWLDVNELIAKSNQLGNRITLERIHEIVSTSDKQRFALSEDGLKIRANQGHSVRSVDLQLEPVEPPGELYHGTVAGFLEPIRRLGLSKRSRNHVHLSRDVETATIVAKRRGKPVILTIASREMFVAGRSFFLSANNVWLVDSVPVEFILFPNEDRLD